MECRIDSKCVQVWQTPLLVRRECGVTGPVSRWTENVSRCNRLPAGEQIVRTRESSVTRTGAGRRVRVSAAFSRGALDDLARLIGPRAGASREPIDDGAALFDRSAQLLLHLAQA